MTVIVLLVIGYIASLAYAYKHFRPALHWYLIPWLIAYAIAYGWTIGQLIADRLPR